MNKYNHWLGKLFNKLFGNGDEYAVTLGQTTYYSCVAGRVTPKWRKHEDEHKKQWARDGKVKFLSTYLWQYLTKGYENIEYEREAREVELK